MCETRQYRVNVSCVYRKLTGLVISDSERNEGCIGFTMNFFFVCEHFFVIVKFENRI